MTNSVGRDRFFMPYYRSKLPEDGLNAIGRSDKKCPPEKSGGQSGFVEPQAARTVAMTASTNPIDSSTRFTTGSGNDRLSGIEARTVSVVLFKTPVAHV